MNSLEKEVHAWRGRLYALMGLAYYRKPSRAFLQGMAETDPFCESVFPEDNREIAEGLRMLSSSLAPFKKGVPDPDLERLQWDYMRMFTGPGKPKAPPWESFYRTEERIIFSAYSLDVRAFYERFGLVFEHKNQEPDDHIGLELEFMAHLCNRCSGTHRKENGKGCAAALHAQREFLDRHLLAWAPEFCRDVRDGAETGFFAGLAWLTEGFLFWDQGFLEALA